MTAATNPLRPSPEAKRRALTSHFLASLEPLLRSGARYVDLSVERIIQAGGIARSTFYDYFEDKWALLSAMADDVLEELFAKGVTWWSFPDTGTKSELRSALLPAIETHQQHDAILAAVAEAAAYDAGVRERRARLIDEVVRDLTSHIKRSQRAASASPDLDPERTAKWLIWMFERGLYELVTPASAAETTKLLDALTEIVWRTLYEGYR
jgi:TetR/AcrR family transcriptional regulator, ethionamide resistance regulator